MLFGNKICKKKYLKDSPLDKKGIVKLESTKLTLSKTHYTYGTGRKEVKSPSMALMASYIINYGRTLSIQREINEDFKALIILPPTVIWTYPKYIFKCN